MPRFPLLFTVVFSALLCGCASPESTSLSNHELYEQTVNEEKMVTASAARYLSRSVLSATSDSIKPGIYTPSEVERLLANGCDDGGSVNGALIALNNNKVDSYRHVPEIGPFRALPRDLTYYEIRNRDERRRPEYRPLGTVTERPLLALHCSAPVRRNACETSASQAPQINPASAVKDLDFVVLISESEAQKCERLHNAASDLTRSSNRDLLTRAAIEEENKRTVELAAVEFRSDDMPRLVRLLYKKYQGASGSSADMPAVLQREVTNVIAAVLAAARKSFKEQKVPDAVPRFSRDNPPIGRENHAAAWFRRPAPAGATQVYLDPIAVRAPFYLCYNDGAFQYVTARYNLISQLLRRGDSPWRFLTRDEVSQRAQTQLQYEAMYKQCLSSQFYFVMSREIAHLVAKSQGRSETAVEATADCFGFINTRRHTKFDLGVFSSLALPSTAASDPDVLATRRSLLDQLAAHFSKTALPSTGEEAMQFCGKWADERAKFVAQRGSTQ